MAAREILFISLCSIVFVLNNLVDGTNEPLSLTAVNKNYTRSITYPLAQDDRVDFVGKFDRAFFSTTGRSQNFTSDDIQRSIKCGLDVIRNLTFNFEKFKIDLHRTNVGYSTDGPNADHSISLPETRYSYKYKDTDTTDDGTPSNIDVIYYNVKVVQFPKVELIGLSHSSKDAERYASFDVETKCRTTNVTLICGEHNVTMTDGHQTTNGTFCYKFSEIVYSGLYRQYRDVDNYVRTVKRTEDIYTKSEDVESITFSISFDYWFALGIVHLKGLREKIASDYVWILAERFRSTVETSPNYLDSHRYFLNLYGRHVSSRILPEFFRLYSRSTNSNNDNSSIDNNNHHNGQVTIEKYGNQITLTNFDAYVNARSNSQFSETTPTTYDINVITEYERDKDGNYATAVTWTNGTSHYWHGVPRCLTKFSIRVVAKNNDYSVVNETVIENVKFTFDNDNESVDNDNRNRNTNDIKNYVESVVAEKLTSFLQTVLLDKECSNSS